MQAQQDQNWMSSNIARVPELLRGVGSIRQISQMFISEFTPVLGAQLGVVYLIDEEKHPDELRRYGHTLSRRTKTLARKYTGLAKV